MKKLIVTLVVAILTTIIFLGWGLDTLFDEYKEQKDTDEFSPYRRIIAPLANTLDKTNNFEQFVATWQSQNQQQLTLTPYAEFPLPASLRDNFNKGEPLVLESEALISVNQLLPSHQQVLTLHIQRPAIHQDSSTLQVALTILFYAGILLCLFIWIYPLIRRLRLLTNTAKTFGEGNFSERIHISAASYIIDIENEFNRMAEKIEILVEDNKMLSNAVSHDLRTPLARLRFGIEALNETNNPDNRDKYIRHLSQDIEEMENLVKVLLDYARLEQKMIKVERFPLSLNKLISGCVKNLLTSNTSAIAIDITGLSKTDIIVDGDESYLSMLINNLLSNAQKYSVNEVRISTHQDANGMTMYIEDDGPGIAKENRAKVLKPFIRGEINTKRAGYGMGLAIVGRIADWHGAKVTISKSEILGGALFTVTFKPYQH